MIVFGIAFIIFLVLRLGFEQVSWLTPAVPYLKGIYIACLVAFVICAIVKIGRSI